jgi:hypothetical protein
VEQITELSIFRGDDKTWTLNFKDVVGNAIDITGATVFFTVKENKADSDNDSLIKKDQSSHSDPTNGKTTITLTNSDTNIRVGNYHYDFQLVDSVGLVTTVLSGIFKITQDITTRTS